MSEIRPDIRPRVDTTLQVIREGGWAERFYANCEDSRNLVYTAPEHGVVAKLPFSGRKERIWGDLYYEFQVLDVLKRSRIQPCIAIPQALEYGLEQPYLICSYVPGQVFSSSEFVHTIPQQDLNEMARGLAGIIYWTETVVDYETFHAEHLGWHTPFFPRKNQLNALIKSGETILPDNVCTPRLRELLDDIIESRHVFEPKDQSEDFFFGHNDLHTQNLAVEYRDGRWRLAGVIDFGLAQPSSIAQELRHIWGLSPGAGEICARTYEELSRRRVNRHDIRCWAGAEFALRFRHMFMYGVEPEPFAHARDGLRRIYPEIDWSELDQYAVAA